MVEAAPEVVSHGAEVVHGPRGAGLPFAPRGLVLYDGADVSAGDIKETDVGVVSRRSFFRGVHALADAPFHIRLSGTDPDFTDKDMG